MFSILRRILLTAAFVCGIAVHAQENPAPPERPLAPVPLQQEVVQQNPWQPCVQPPPVVRWQDYQGPFQKVVGVFARRLERKSVHPPHYKPGEVLCSLTLGAKFRLFAQDTFDPVTFLSVSFDAGLSQAQNNDPTFGQGAAGYGKRFGASLADQASSEFFKSVMYSTIFREDPRYYRLIHASGKERLFHAMGHTFVAHQENGGHIFNFTEWLGTTSSVALADVYHPGLAPGVGPAAQRVGINIASDMGFDVLREFWPEVARKFKLPFRDENEPQGPAPISPSKF